MYFTTKTNEKTEQGTSDKFDGPQNLSTGKSYILQKR